MRESHESVEVILGGYISNLPSLYHLMTRGKSKMLNASIIFRDDVITLQEGMNMQCSGSRWSNCHQLKVGKRPRVVH